MSPDSFLLIPSIPPSLPPSLLPSLCRLDDLWGRFEAPNESNRWDRPLIRYTPPSLPSSSSSSASPSSGEGEGGGEEEEGREEKGREVAYRQVLQALTQGKAPAAGLSTAMVRGGGREGGREGRGGYVCMEKKKRKRTPIVFLSPVHA